MKVTIAVIERNPRRNGQAVYNGADVRIEGANLQGTEKQIALAESVIVAAVKELTMLVLRRVSPSNIFDGGVLDAEIAKLNAAMAQMAPLAGTRAADWIEHRHLGRDVVAHMMRNLGS